MPQLSETVMPPRPSGRMKPEDRPTSASAFTGAVINPRIDPDASASEAARERWLVSHLDCVRPVRVCCLSCCKMLGLNPLATK